MYMHILCTSARQLNNMYRQTQKTATRLTAFQGQALVQGTTHHATLQVRTGNKMRSRTLAHAERHRTRSETPHTQRDTRLLAHAERHHTRSETPGSVLLTQANEEH